jgi:hypothetical protein
LTIKKKIVRTLLIQGKFFYFCQFTFWNPENICPRRYIVMEDSVTEIRVIDIIVCSKITQIKPKDAVSIR